MCNKSKLLRDDRKLYQSPEGWRSRSEDAAMEEKEGDGEMRSGCERKRRRRRRVGGRERREEGND